MIFAKHTVQVRYNDLQEQEYFSPRYDQIEKIKNGLVHHGKYNDRAYLMKMSDWTSHQIISSLSELCGRNGYSKIFAKIPRKALFEFERNGYIKEASVPGFYNNSEDACFMSKYLSSHRAVVDSKINDKIIQILELCRQKAADNVIIPYSSYISTIRILKPSDIPAMISVYRSVFSTYPFPIFDPSYILQTMKDNIVYFGVFEDAKLIGCSSAEMDRKSSTVEMTDFAVLPEYRGYNLAVFLLKRMEKEMRKKRIKTAYTIARSISAGMNITFSKQGYRYTGTLKNNTNISGSIECMNIWYKKL